MPILNYTTSIASEKTVGEITSLLARKGARSINTDFTEEGLIHGITFVMVLHGLPVRFQLPSNASGVCAVMMKEKPYSYSYSRKTREQWQQEIRQQAERVAWRILKDWVEAQIALVESSQAEMAQVFMPYAVEASGQTMFQLFEESYKQRALTAG
jgi:hypothetical protein